MNGRGFLLLKRSFCRLGRISLPLSSAPPLLTRFFTSNDDFPSQDIIRPETKPTATPSPEDGESLGDDCISTPELKKRISKYMEGDMDAVPSIFQAILERKLSGKHNDTDDELMEEMRSKLPHASEHEQEKGDYFTSDYDSDTDEEEDNDSDSSS